MNRYLRRSISSAVAPLIITKPGNYEITHKPSRATLSRWQRENLAFRSPSGAWFVTKYATEAFLEAEKGHVLLRLTKPEARQMIGALNHAITYLANHTNLDPAGETRDLLMETTRGIRDQIGGEF